MSDSPAHAFLRRTLAICEGNVRAAHVAVDRMLNGCAPHELAGLLYDWSFWARPEQLLPETDWQSALFKCGRGVGKTRAVVEYALQEIAEGRAKRIALVGQNEDTTIEVLVTGATGMLALAAPWLGASFSNNSVHFSNGAIATVYSAQEPNHLRGPAHDLAIATEISSWPKAHREEAMSNLKLGLRLGYGRLLADSTPKRSCPLMRAMLAEHAANPARHLLIEGRTRDNILNMTPGLVEAQEARLGGTLVGREELDGTFLDDGAEDMLFQKSWIESSRRGMPDKFARVVIGVDPAMTNTKRSDASGIVVAGLGYDGIIYVLENHTGKRESFATYELVIAKYIELGASLVVAERNAGGQLVRDMCRLTAQGKGLVFSEITGDRAPAFAKGVVQFRAFTSTAKKTERAKTASVLVQQGRVSLVPGRLDNLEERLTCFSGVDGEADDAVDAFVIAVNELGDAARAKAVNPCTGLALAQRLMGGTNIDTLHDDLETVRAKVAAATGGRGGTTINHGPQPRGITVDTFRVRHSGGGGGSWGGGRGI